MTGQTAEVDLSAPEEERAAWKPIVFVGLILIWRETGNGGKLKIYYGRKGEFEMSVLQSQVIQSLNGLSDENLKFLLEMIQRFMKPTAAEDNNFKGSVTSKRGVRRIGSLEGWDLIDADYDFDECNNEIAEMFGVFEQ